MLMTEYLVKNINIVLSCLKYLNQLIFPASFVGILM